MIPYAHWFRPHAEMYKFPTSFTASRMMSHLRLSVRLAKDHLPSYLEHLYLVQDFLIALYEFKQIDFETYAQFERLQYLIKEIYKRSKFKMIFD